MQLPHSTNKQKQIIQLILQFRYLNSKQIQKLLNHKDPKTINTWLKDLTNNKYLGRDYTKTFGLNHIPAIYYLTVNGIRYLKKEGLINSEYAKRLYGDKDKSDTFKNHHIFLANIFLQLNLSIYTYVSQSQLWEYEELKNLKIDAYIKKSTKGLTKRYFLNLFDKYSSNYLMEYVLKQYIKLHHSNKWKEVINSKYFPEVLFILPNTQKLSITRSLIKKLHPSFKISLTTEKQLETKGFTSDIWDGC